LDGEIFARVGERERHNRVAGNAFFAFRSRTPGTACTPYVADMRLRLESSNVFYYPDVMLCCDPADANPRYKTAPCAIVEVLSPSTQSIDEREKLIAYRRIPSLRYYIMVDSESVRAVWHERADDSGWQSGMLERDEILNVRCGGSVYPLSLLDFYGGTGLLVG
jgi:Uma2 family endonuclease